MICVWSSVRELLIVHYLLDLESAQVVRDCAPSAPRFFSMLSGLLIMSRTWKVRAALRNNCAPRLQSIEEPSKGTGQLQSLPQRTSAFLCIAHALPYLHHRLSAAAHAVSDAQALAASVLRQELARMQDALPPQDLSRTPFAGLAALRLAHLRSLPAPPPHSYALPAAEVYGNPTLTAFLRSEETTCRVDGFRIITEAREFAQKLFEGRSTGMQAEDLNLTPGGKGALPRSQDKDCPEALSA